MSPSAMQICALRSRSICTGLKGEKIAGLEAAMRGFFTIGFK